MVIIIPQEGLGNRVRVIMSALKWSRATGKKVYFVWFRAKNFNSRFDSLFEPIPNMLELSSVWRIVWDFILRFKSLLKRLGISLKHFGLSLFNGREYKAIREYMSNNQYSRVTIASLWSSFYEGDSPTVNEVFHLRPELQAELEEITKKFTNNTIGIHIRRTDNKCAIKFSPLSLFEERINNEIQKNKDCNFYLATDDVKIKEEFLQKYGTRIIVHQGPLERCSEAGMKHAVLELYALSRCSRIWGSFYSSFSDLAAEIAGMPLEVIRNNECESL